MPNTESPERTAVAKWIKTFVIGHNLCPFAPRESERIRVAISRATAKAELLEDLRAEFQLLDDQPDVETSVLVHPTVLGDFVEYNQFLDDADELIRKLQLEGVYQVASFHPEYRFADTEPDDPQNYTNRSPYPLLHILRESSVEKAVAGYPNVSEIPERNIDLMNKIGTTILRTQLSAYRSMLR